jgi:RNA polymerase sigma factor (sigma-70 family)
MDSDKLLDIYLKDKTIENRNRLVMAFRPLAIKVANKYMYNNRVLEFEDLITWAFMGIIKALEYYDPSKAKGTLKNYLYQRTCFYMIDRLRRIKDNNVDILSLSDDMTESGATLSEIIEDPMFKTPEESTIESDIKEILSAEINKFPIKEQICMNYYYFGDLETKDIAKFLGISVSRVSQLMKNSYIRLRQISYLKGE